MGREIRMVPPNWEHPRYTAADAKYQNWIGNFKPMFDQTFAEAAKEWKEELAKWERGEFPEYCSDESKEGEYWEWNGNPPDRDYYRPYETSEATWFQVFETVSEGSPVSPPFATKEELVDYLVANGDFWDQDRWKRGDRFMQPKKPGWDRKAAESFVGADWAPSMIVQQDSSGTKIFEARDGAPS